MKKANIEIEIIEQYIKITNLSPYDFFIYEEPKSPKRKLRWIGIVKAGQFIIQEEEPLNLEKILFKVVWK